MNANPFYHPFVLRSLAAGLDSEIQALRRYQDEQLRCLVRHAAANVPFYRNLYRKAGVDATAFRGIVDLPTLPFVTRDHLQRTPAADLVAQGVVPESLVLHRSSGSTGIPTCIRRTRVEELFLQSMRLQAMARLGLRPWQRRARVIYVATGMEAGARPISPEHGRKWIFPFRNFSGYADPAETAQQLAAYQPALVSGHPSFLERICASAPPDLLRKIRPHQVICGGEYLTKPVRTLVQDAWRCTVNDYYGANEFNLLAWQQDSSGPYEIAGLCTLLEATPEVTLAKNRSGPESPRSGEVVGTALWSFAAPIIRHPLGDEVTVQETDPDYGLPVRLREVRGRRTDRFVTRHGDTVHAYEVVEPLLAEPYWIQSYRLEQNHPGKLVARMVPAPGIPSARLESGALEYRRYLAPNFDLDLQWIDAIPLESHGKRRLFVRNIQLPESDSKGR